MRNDRYSNCTDDTPHYCLSLEPFYKLRERLDNDLEHSRQVTRLSLILFDELSHLHELGKKDRFYLEAAALCHDIGRYYDAETHHKISRDLILAESVKGINLEERTIIALTARHHRRRFPKSDDVYYQDLSKKDQLKVLKLASLLRIADGLDSTHRQIVVDMKATDDGIIVTLELRVRHNALTERLVVARKKQDLFEKTYDRILKIREQDLSQIPVLE